MGRPPLIGMTKQKEQVYEQEKGFRLNYLVPGPPGFAGFTYIAWKISRFRFVFLR